MSESLQSPPPQDMRGFFMLPQAPMDAGYYVYGRLFGRPAKGAYQYAHPVMMTESSGLPMSGRLSTDAASASVTSVWREGRNHRIMTPIDAGLKLMSGRYVSTVMRSQ